MKLLSSMMNQQTAILSVQVPFRFFPILQAEAQDQRRYAEAHTPARHHQRAEEGDQRPAHLEDVEMIEGDGQ